jgi:hypothetical protein
MNLVHAKANYKADTIELQMCSLCKVPMNLSGGLELKTIESWDMRLSGFSRISYDDICTDCIDQFKAIWKQLEDLESKVTTAASPDSDTTTKAEKNANNPS